MMIVILLGAPGSGKGTQAVPIAEHLGLPIIATGDLFRAAVREGTPVGLEARRYMDAGRLVPDEITIRLLRDRLARADAQGGAILDGFPRTRAQAEAITAGLTQLGRELGAAILIDVPDDVVMQRILNRGQGRSDDNPETVRERLRVYHGEIDPLLTYYDELGLLRRVDGSGDADEVYEQVRRSAEG